MTTPADDITHVGTGDDITHVGTGDDITRWVHELTSAGKYRWCPHQVSTGDDHTRQVQAMTSHRCVQVMSMVRTGNSITRWVQVMSLHRSSVKVTMVYLTFWVTIRVLNKQWSDLTWSPSACNNKTKIVKHIRKGRVKPSPSSGIVQKLSE